MDSEEQGCGEKDSRPGDVDLNAATYPVLETAEEFTVWLERRHVRYLSQHWKDITRRIGTTYFPVHVYVECDHFQQVVPDLLQPIAKTDINLFYGAFGMDGSALHHTSSARDCVNSFSVSSSGFTGVDNYNPHVNSTNSHMQYGSGPNFMFSNIPMEGLEQTAGEMFRRTILGRSETQRDRGTSSRGGCFTGAQVNMVQDSLAVQMTDAGGQGRPVLGRALHHGTPASMHHLTGLSHNVHGAGPFGELAFGQLCGSWPVPELASRGTAGMGEHFGHILMGRSIQGHTLHGGTGRNDDGRTGLGFPRFVGPVGIDSMQTNLDGVQGGNFGAYLNTAGRVLAANEIPCVRAAEDIDSLRTVMGGMHQGGDIITHLSGTRPRNPGVQIGIRESQRTSVMGTHYGNNLDALLSCIGPLDAMQIEAGMGVPMDTASQALPYRPDFCATMNRSSQRTQGGPIPGPFFQPVNLGMDKLVDGMTNHQNPFALGMRTPALPGNFHFGTSVSDSHTGALLAGAYPMEHWTQTYSSAPVCGTGLHVPVVKMYHETSQFGGHMANQMCHFGMQPAAVTASVSMRDMGRSQGETLGVNVGHQHHVSHNWRREHWIEPGPEHLPVTTASHLDLQTSMTDIFS